MTELSILLGAIGILVLIAIIYNIYSDFKYDRECKENEKIHQDKKK